MILNKLKISTQVIIIVVFSFIVGVGAIFFFYDIGYKDELNNLFVKRVNKVKLHFVHHEHEISEFMMSLKETILLDDNVGRMLLAKDREGLYKYQKNLYERLSSNFSITHFYFHTTDGAVLLRMHDKKHFGDMVERPEFEKAHLEKTTASGFSAGKTGFAYRVISPYYYKGRLVGYVELGHDLSKFMEHLLLQPDFTEAMLFFTGKDQVNKKDWAEFYSKKTPGYEWNSFNHYAAVAVSENNESRLQCASDEEMLDSYIENENPESLYHKIDSSRMCSGFAVHDALGGVAGVFLFSSDLTAEINIFTKLSRTVVVGLFLPFMISAFLLWLLVRASITGPVNNLTQVASSIADGNFGERIDVTADDEVSNLANAMNKMAAQLEIYKVNMELLVDMRTEELRSANDDVVKANERLKEAYDRLSRQTEDIETAYKELEKVNIELKGLERIKTEFLQTISHELRSPLTPILGYLELMRDGDIGEFNDVQKDILQEMFMCARNLQLILDELLEAASIQAGRIYLDISRIDVKEVLQEAGANMEKFAKENNIKIVYEIQKGNYMVDGDRRRIYEIVAHLLRNAIKFSHKQGDVVLIAGSVPDGVEFSIKDYGIGIAENRLNKIFEAFYQIDSSSARFYEGVGLGLFLVRKLVDIHDGKIRVESEIGKGTKFTVFIPSTYKSMSA